MTFTPGVLVRGHSSQHDMGHHDQSIVGCGMLLCIDLETKTCGTKTCGFPTWIEFRFQLSLEDLNKMKDEKPWLRMSRQNYVKTVLPEFRQQMEKIYAEVIPPPGKGVVDPGWLIRIGPVSDRFQTSARPVS